MGRVKAVAQGCVTEPGLLLIPQVRQQLSEGKSHVQEGEVVGLPAEPSEPAPLEVWGGETTPGKALTLKHVLCHHLSPHGELHMTLLRAVTAVLGGSQPSTPPLTMYPVP